MSKELFGTDGIRGIPGEYPLDDQTLYWVGRSIGGYLRLQNEHPRVLIGTDTRESGTHIASEIAAGLAKEGIHNSFAGVITTPGVACLVRKEGFAAGVVISASHNPYHDNGIKLFAGSGMKFPDDIEEQIEIEIVRHRNAQAHVPAVRLTPDRQFDDAYLEFLRGCAIPGSSLSGLKLVLDCANGAASSLAPALFRSLGANVIAIHDNPDGRNINANCGSLYPQDLQQKVPKAGAALGVAFDGDAVLLAATRYLRSVGKLKGKAVVGTTMTNLGLERALAAEGLALLRVPVGDRYVLEEMLRSGANLGGEQSGHVIFLDDATTGDGLLTALKIACLVALVGPLDGLVKDLKVYPQTILNVKVRAKPPLESLPEVSRALHDATRALGDSGRVVLRYSGTEPKARVMVEAERAEDVQHWAELLASAVRAAVGS